MSSPYIAEIRMFAGNFAPSGWAFCDGALVPISENDTLFSLIGTTYGGDGETTFALPDLRGRVPVHAATGFVLGQRGGAETVTLTQSQIPSHTHAFAAANVVGSQITPSGNLPAQSFNVTPYINDVPSGSFNAAAIDSDGGSQPHDNFQPYLCIDFIISLFGIYPSQS